MAEEKTILEQIVTPDERIQRRLAHHDFWEYCLHMDPEFFAQRPFLQKVAEAFMWLYRWYLKGVAKKVSVSMPPRAGKSYIASLFCSWWLAKLPTTSVMRNACTARLYEKFSYDVRNIIRSEKFKQVFPDVKLSPDKQSVEGWNLTTATQVSYFGAGVGGTIIGFGAKLAMSDDLYKGIEEALSPGVNEKTHLWKDGTHDSRMEKNCPEIFIGTRWTKRDVIGVAIEKKKIDRQLKISALDENNQSFCEAVKSTAEYHAIRDDVDGMIWEAEYQQEPAETKGLLFPISELKFYDPEKVRLDVSHKLLYIDPADDGGDDLAAPLAYLVGDKLFIHRAVCTKEGTDVTETACADMAVEEKVNAVRIEAIAGWILFAKGVFRQLDARFPDCDKEGIKKVPNKQVRILAQSAWIKNHCVFRSDYKNDPDYRQFMKVLTEYMREGGNNQQDGSPDALAGVAVYYRATFPSIFP